MAGLDGGKPHWAKAPRMSFRAGLGEPLKPLKIRFTTKNAVVATDPEIAAAVVATARLLSDLGHDVEEAEAPLLLVEEFLPLWQHVISDVPLMRWSRAEPVTRWLAEPGRALRADAMVTLRRAIAARQLEGYNQADVWLTPTVGIATPLVGAFAGLSAEARFHQGGAAIASFTAPFNVTGQPAASVPVGLTKAGLPIGVQIVGRELAEDVVLGVSRQLEQAAPWRGRRAPIGMDH
jgi:amidase